MKEFLSIGEISRLFGLNIQTLYYYDSIGLFSPRYRDPATGRRKYEFDQVYPLATICYMKRLGYSLQDIKEQMNTQHVGEKLDSLRQRSDELHRQWHELISVDEAIQRKIRFIGQAMQDIQVDQISIRSYGTRRYIAIGGEELLYRHSSFYFYPTIAFYEKDRKYFGAYLDPNEEKIPDFIPEEQIREIPAGDFLCGYHLGSYEKARDTIKRIRRSHPELVLASTALNFNIVDQFVESDRANYITSTQIRILK